MYCLFQISILLFSNWCSLTAGATFVVMASAKCSTHALYFFESQWDIHCDVSVSQMKKRQELKEKEVEERRKSYSLSATPSKSPSKTSPSKSPGVTVGDSSQVLRGGPKTWPVEVLEHVHRLIDLGWSSSKVSNHYSLVCFGLTPQQVDLVRSMPTEKRQSAEKRSDGLSEELLQKVRQLILEGKTNTAVLNHYSLVNTNTSEAQVQSVRTGIEKEAWRLSGTGTASSLSLTKSASKIKQPTLSKQVCFRVFGIQMYLGSFSI